MAEEKEPVIDENPAEESKCGVCSGRILEPGMT